MRRVRLEPAVLAPPTKRAGSDALVVRHAETCVPGAGTAKGCRRSRLPAVDVLSGGTKRGHGDHRLGQYDLLDSGASSTDGDYAGLTLRTTGGVGAGQYCSISAHTTAARTSPPSTHTWTVIPNGTTTYSFEYMLGATSFPLHKRDCLGTATPATLPILGGTLADRRRLISNIYYIGDVASPDAPGEVIPTLVRAQLDVAGGTPVHRAPGTRSSSGIEAFCAWKLGSRRHDAYDRRAPPTTQRPSSG